ncbi:branched-chain amino acid ABC transporter permease [Chloroflexota bacterium]
MKFNNQIIKGYMPLIVIAVIGAILPFTGVPRSWILYLFLFFIYLAIANMWNLLCGYAGLISLCQPAFIGIAGYTVAIFTWSGLPLLAGMIAGAIIAGVFAMIISIPVFRLRGIYFAIGTLVVPEAMRIVFYIWRPVGGSMVGGGAGYMIKGANDFSTNDIYLMALITGIASLFIVKAVLRSKLGLGLAAIRDSDRTAASSGINVFNVKLVTFIIGAMVTGLAGSVFYISQSYIEPTAAFNIRWTMILMLAVVIGGMRTEIGPIVGAAIVTILHFTLARQANISLLLQGVILVGIMLLAPEGIVGYIRKVMTRRTCKRIMEDAAKQDKESSGG